MADAETAGSPWVDDDFSKVRLISATDAAGRADSLTLGLHFIMKKGWKIYWRTAGDAGYPPSIDWSGSGNLALATILWPAPERFSILGFETQGYKDEVVLPIAVRPATVGQAISLKASVDYLVCSELCVPLKADLGLTIPQGDPRPSSFVHLINRFATRVPGDGSAHGLRVEKAEIIESGGKTTIKVTASASFPFQKPDLFVEGPEELVFSAPRISLSGDARRVTLSVALYGVEDLKTGLAGTSMTFTLVDGERAAEKTLELAPPSAGTGSGALSIFMILILAVIGGLILNLMPCVLPVLSIKLLGVVRHGGGDRSEVRLNFIASAGGILFAFMVLAGALVTLKAAGSTVGWGIQFQHPWFLIALTIVVTLFACNLWGFLEVRLPIWVADLGEHSGHLHGLGGSFLSGVFATLLATPCSAPFLGTAVAFALSRGTYEIFAIFAAIAVGLALPFLAIAAFPGLATMLPRPGPWMVVLRRILGFALAATGLWLLSVLAAQAGYINSGVIGALMAGSVAALYFRHRMPSGLVRARTAAAALLAVFVVAAFAVPQGTSKGKGLFNGGGKLESIWVPFDEAAIPKLVAAGKTVLVDVTAEWCITCLVNKSLVLSKGEVLNRLSNGEVVAMQADWTLPDDSIARYLASFQRYAIPFDVVYGPGTPEGIVLPELLSRKAVLDAFNRAGGEAIASSSDPG
ncbi:MAG: protein-disulfide reductase DsbD domain-containing protein [Rhodospirillales bacterium]